MNGTSILNRKYRRKSKFRGKGDVFSVVQRSLRCFVESKLRAYDESMAELGEGVQDEGIICIKVVGTL